MSGVRAEAKALVAELLERLAVTGVRELEVRRDGIRVKVSRAPATLAAGASGGAGAVLAPAPVPAPGPSVIVAQQAASDAKAVTAPLTGIFYRSTSPQTPPFVQVGSAIGAGDVIGLIEAMKLFNEIKSTQSGRVKRIFVENGQLVRAHQPLLELE